MKTRLSSLVIVLCLVLSMALTAFAAQLTDIENHWAKEQIKAWVEKGLAKGYEDGTFRPDNNISRAEFMAFVNRAFNYQEKADIDYKDVKEDAWYADVIKIAKAAGYISGYQDGTMKPDNPISRQEAAIIIMRILGLVENPAGANGFRDASSIPAWSKGAVGAVAAAGIMGGYPDGTFRVANFITRAEAVVTLDRALSSKAGVVGEEVISDEEGAPEETPDEQEVSEDAKQPATGKSGGGGGSKKTVSAVSITTDPGDVSSLPNDAVVTVTLETATSDASIYYTLDGTTPTKDSTLYEGPFTVTAPGDGGGTVTVKAIGVKTGYYDSMVAAKEIVFKAAAEPIEYASTEDKNFDIEVEFGTPEAEAIAALANTVHVFGSEGEEGTANISWTIAGYNGNVAGDYTATGNLTLPVGWTGTPDDVTATVTVKPQVVETSLTMSAADVDATTGEEFTMAVTVQGTVADADKENLVRFYGVIPGLSAADIVLAEIEGGKPAIVEDATERERAGAGEGDLVLAWGPAGGFPLKSHDYSAGVTTGFKATINKAGTYTVTFVFYDITGGKQLNAKGEAATITVTDPPTHSTYKFSYEVPADVVAGTEVVVPVTFATDVEGKFGYDSVRFKFAAQGPEGATVTFKAVDSEGVEHTFTNEGCWGPPGGFALPARYEATTGWTLNFAVPGEYTITFGLEDLASAGAVITEESVTINVRAAEAPGILTLEGPEELTASEELVYYNLCGYGDNLNDLYERLSGATFAWTVKHGEEVVVDEVYDFDEFRKDGRVWENPDGGICVTASERFVLPGTYTLTGVLSHPSGWELTVTKTVTVKAKEITMEPAEGTSTVVLGAELEESTVTLSGNYNAEGLKTFISLAKDGQAVNFDTVFEAFNLATKVGEGEIDGPYNMTGPYSTFQYGPPDGFAVEAGVAQVTTITGKVKADAPLGSYVITTEVKSGDDVLATAIYTLVVVAELPERSTYVFEYSDLEDVVTGEDVVAYVTLKTAVRGKSGYDAVLFEFEAEGPGDVTFTATDSAGQTHTFTNSGTWGPDGGFELPAQYNETTEWTLNFAAQGQYTITFKLVDVSGEEPVVIISQAVEIGVGAPSPIKYKSRALVKFDIGVDFGTSEAEALAALKKSIYVYGTKGEEGVATISWTIEGYNGNVAGDYTATGRLTLPAGWTGSPADVTAKVTVKPEVTGPIEYASTEAVNFDIEVDFGTTETGAIAELAKTVRVYGSGGEEGEANISWSIDGYDGNVAGDYTATGRLTLPAGWTGSPADVTATVTVKPIVYDRTEEEDLDVEVAFGTSIDGALAALAESIGVIGTKGETGVATISWSIDGYDGNVAGDYTATGVLTLPAGWVGDPDDVTAKVTVKPDDDLPDDDLLLAIAAIEAGNYQNLQVDDVYNVGDQTAAVQAEVGKILGNLGLTGVSAVVTSAGEGKFTVTVRKGIAEKTTDVVATFVGRAVIYARSSGMGMPTVEIKVKVDGVYITNYMLGWDGDFEMKPGPDGVLTTVAGVLNDLTRVRVAYQGRILSVTYGGSW